ncbi:nucleotidyl transferase AbiEii/AbiGii toxin family protein [Asticcacaulis sp.]|uniref:nucleotidyl transferase AbiEii/AbiGii toxin family protein n=1 Tax=Asticcacaulis sp. TaxID=1872648 RepID=UPI002B7A7F3C|nr:nucleotidyl transferase AbiEii/AbiGii toxin family protein [Asticcacaulis sp.]HTM82262.1 nucleotidyl transferase AbiEii/AbiGii toxin family protein [Asticcacaulis sp.]
MPQLTAIVGAAAERCNIPTDEFRVVPDPDDEQTLLVFYPMATPNGDYLRPYVKIESGAKSALDPNAVATIEPYVNDDFPDGDLRVPNVTTVDPQRTFWDKVIILHGLRSWFDRRKELKGDGQRVSRHYYDLYRLLIADVGAEASANSELGENCIAHAALFFNRPDYDLATAKPGTFRLSPHDGMVDALRRDYSAMSGMIFGKVPDFDAILEAIAELEDRLNATG